MSNILVFKKKPAKPPKKGVVIWMGQPWAMRIVGNKSSLVKDTMMLTGKDPA